MLENGKLGKLGIQKDFEGSDVLRIKHATESSNALKEHERLMKRNNHLAGSPTPAHSVPNDEAWRATAMVQEAHSNGINHSTQNTPKSQAQPNSFLARALEEKQDFINARNIELQKQREAELLENERIKEQEAKIQALKDERAGLSINESVDFSLGESIKAKPIKATSVMIDDTSEPLKATYAIVDKNDIKPSFERAGVQGRSFKQEKVIKNIQEDFKASLIFDKEGSFDGVPIIAKDGQVIVGNHRSEAINALDERARKAYEKAVKEKFGIDLKPNEIIVRKLFEKTSKEDILRLAFASNTGRESNFGEKALANLAKFEKELQDLPSYIKADSVDELSFLVAKHLDKQGNGLDTFNANLALLAKLAKNSKNGDILASLNNALKHLDKQEANKILNMFVQNAGAFHNIAKDSELKNLDLRSYLSDALLASARSSDTRAQDFKALLESLEHYTSLSEQARKQFDELHPNFKQDIKAQALGYALARFARLENPSANLFEFLSSAKSKLEELIAPNLFDPNGKAMSEANMNDFLKLILAEGQANKDIPALLNAITKLDELETQAKQGMGFEDISKIDESAISRATPREQIAQTNITKPTLNIDKARQSLKDEVDISKLNEEQKNIFDVFTGVKDSTILKGKDLNDFYTLEKGSRTAGARKILIKHAGLEKTGGLSNDELLDMSRVIKEGQLDKESFSMHDNYVRYAYDLQDENGLNLRLVVDEYNDGKKIFDYYSNRNFTDYSTDSTKKTGETANTARANDFTKETNNPSLNNSTTKDPQSQIKLSDSKEYNELIQNFINRYTTPLRHTREEIYPKDILNDEALYKEYTEDLQRYIQQEKNRNFMSQEARNDEMELRRLQVLKQLKEGKPLNPLLGDDEILDLGTSLFTVRQMQKDLAQNGFHIELAPEVKARLEQYDKGYENALSYPSKEVEEMLAYKAEQKQAGDLTQNENMLKNSQNFNISRALKDLPAENTPLKLDEKELDELLQRFDNVENIKEHLSTRADSEQRKALFNLLDSTLENPHFQYIKDGKDKFLKKFTSSGKEPFFYLLITKDGNKNFITHLKTRDYAYLEKELNNADELIKGADIIEGLRQQAGASKEAINPQPPKANSTTKDRQSQIIQARRANARTLENLSPSKLGEQGYNVIHLFEKASTLSDEQINKDYHQLALKLINEEFDKLKGNAKDKLLKMQEFFDERFIGNTKLSLKDLTQIKNKSFEFPKDLLEKAKQTTEQQNKMRRELIEEYFDIKPIKEFGTNYAEFYHDGVRAVKKLLSEKQGQVTGAFEKEINGQMSDIDLVWGEITDAQKHKGFGLVHAIDKRKAEFMAQGLSEQEAQQKALELMQKIPEVIEKGQVIKDDKGRLRIEYNNQIVGIKDNFYGEPSNKWIVTSYELKEDTPSLYTSGVITKGEPLPLNSNANSTTKDPQSQIKLFEDKLGLDESSAKNLYEWHKDSDKLTKNSDGTPKVFYHTLGREFNRETREFEPIKPFEVFDKTRQNMSGFWFFGEKTDYGANKTYEVFLKMKNPFEHGELTESKAKEIEKILGVRGNKRYYFIAQKMGQLFEKIRKAGYSNIKINHGDQIWVVDKNGKYDMLMDTTYWDDVLNKDFSFKKDISSMPEYRQEVYKKLQDLAKKGLLEENASFYKEFKKITKGYKMLASSESEIYFNYLKDANFKKNFSTDRYSRHYGGGVDLKDNEYIFKNAGYDSIKYSESEFVVFEPNQIKSINNKGTFNKDDANIFHSNAHLGTGLFAGSITGIEQDENGNLSFNPAKFVAGFLGGSLASKATSTALKNPKLKAKAESFAKNSFDSFKNILQESKLDLHSRKALENIFGEKLIQALDTRSFITKPSYESKRLENELKKEARGLYNVSFNGKNATLIRQDLENVESAILYARGSKYKGAKHIRLEHSRDKNQNGYVRAREVVNLGKSLREFLKSNEPFIDKNGARLYEWEDEQGVRFRVVVNDIKNSGADSNPTSATDEIITFYSDRNLKEPMSFKNPALQENKEPLSQDKPKLHSNTHLGSGLFTGSIAGIEEDENGNLSFDPAKFVAGFLGGVGASKMLSSDMVKRRALGFVKSLSQDYQVLSTKKPKLFASILQKMDIKTIIGNTDKAKIEAKELFNDELLKRVKSAIDNDEITAMPKSEFKNEQEFKALFDRIDGKFGYIYTPYKSVKVNTHYAFAHFRKNTYDTNRDNIKGGFFETFKEPLFVVEHKRDGQNEPSVYFYKPFYDEDKKLLNLFGIGVNNNGSVLFKTYYLDKQGSRFKNLMKDKELIIKYMK